MLMTILAQNNFAELGPWGLVILVLLGQAGQIWRGEMLGRAPRETNEIAKKELGDGNGRYGELKERLDRLEDHMDKRIDHLEDRLDRALN